MDRTNYQNEIVETLDEALNSLDTKEFNILIKNLKEILEDYN